MTLFNRLLWAKCHLGAVQSRYRVVFEDDLDEPAKVLVPDPNWMAAALNGGVLPPIDAYLRDKDKQAQHRGYSFHWGLVGGAEHPYAEPIGPMSEEEAIEYLIRKDVPNHVWMNRDGSNRPRFRICRVEQIPTDRTYRDAWSINHEQDAA